MKCPYCGNAEDKVIDSRTIRDGEAIRRRRECDRCGRRFTSYEHIEQTQLRIIKKDGRREPYDRAKITLGLQKACEKRPISTGQIETIVDRIESEVCAGKQEVSTRDIGEAVMKELFILDEVAYVRFASVYRQFKDVNEFMKEVEKLQIDLGVSPKGKKKKS